MASGKQSPNFTGGLAHLIMHRALAGENVSGENFMTIALTEFEILTASYGFIVNSYSRISFFFLSVKP